MSSPFAAPSNGDSLPLDELKGALLIIMPTEQIEGIKTTFGDANAVKADVHVVDGSLGGTSFIDTLIFPKILQSNVRREIGTGKPVLGRLGKGQAKPKQSPPWILEAPTDDDIKLASPVWEALQKGDDTPF